MALHKVFALYDVKADVYRFPFHMTTKGLAIRSVVQFASNPESELSKFPMDFTLFLLGEFDDVKGTFKNETAPLPLGTVKEFLPKDA